MQYATDGCRRAMSRGNLEGDGEAVAEEEEEEEEVAGEGEEVMEEGE